MASRLASNSQTGRRLGGMGVPFWVAVLGLMWCVALAGAWPGAVAQGADEPPVLQSVDFNPLPGNRLQIRFRLSAMPKAPPSSFTINDPARIVLDFVGTTNGLSARQQTINVGVADKLSVLEGADRTRASLNLARVVPYNVQVQGNIVVLTLENAGVAAVKAPAVSATSSVAAAGPKRSEAPPPTGGPRTVRDVGFKRGPAGQGIITIKLSNPGIPVDVRQEGNQIVADFQGAPLPRGQERRLDVSDFATPVTLVEALNRDGSARLTIKPNPPFEFLAYQANDLYVVEVKPPAPKTTAEEEKEAEFDPSKKKYKGDLLSLNFQDIEVRAILQILADFTGLNIVVSDNVKGNLTLRLQNVPWDQALDIILRTKGLAKRENGNVIFIAPTEEVTAREKLDLESRKVVQELIPLRTEIIQVNYAKASDLAKLIGGEKTEGKNSTVSILSSRGSIVADDLDESGSKDKDKKSGLGSRTNSLIVTDVPDKIAQVRNLVKQLDRAPRQVLIDSRIVIAVDDFVKDIGVRFGVTGVGVNGSNVGGVTGNLDGTSTIIDSAAANLIGTGQPYPVTIPSLGDRLGVNLPAALGSPSIAFAILGADYLVDLELSALQTEGRGELISNPRVVTADRSEAKILQGQTVETVIPGSGGGEGSTSETNANLELTVTPQITPDDRVLMDLKVTKNDLLSANAAQTITSNREVETQVLVNNGETLVLGGIVENNKTQGKSQVPLLGDIPLLGYLFQRNRDDANKRELLIFVTPQILKEGTLIER